MNFSSWHIWIDTGGTFTDCIATDPHGKRHYVKVLSNSSLRGTILRQISPTAIEVKQHWQAPDNFVRGLKLVTLGGKKLSRTVTAFDAEASTLSFEDAFPEDAELTNITFDLRSGEEAPILACRLVTNTLPSENLPPIQLRLATTKGTNALLEENGAPTLLLITKGFGDFLKIGDQKRPDLFAFNVQKPDPLFNKVIEIPERMDAKGNIIQKLITDSLSPAIKKFLSQKHASVAVALMHSYKNNRHEKQLEQWLQNHGAQYVSCSTDMSPFIKLLPRAQTTVVNAYLEPVLRRYFESVKSELKNSRLFVMNSAAGLVSSEKFKPKDSLLSGPAGGVIGAATIGKKSGKDHIISLDMGGTSTDVARYDTGFDYQFEHVVGNANIKAPALSIETVAAGGGSICLFDGQKLTVGPESAGAHPGPACYGAGGPLTLTDVNLLLGRLQADNFNIPISRNAAEKKLEELLDKMRQAGRSTNRSEVLNGLLQIANERMADAIKKVSLRKGYDPANYTLVAFGGAGAQHAIAIATLLDISSVLIPEKAGLLSAYGLGHASVEEFAEQQILKTLSDLENQISSIINELEEKAGQKLRGQLDQQSEIEIRRRMLFMRLEGQESTLEVEFNGVQTLKNDFKEAYQNRYGHWVEGREVEVESIRVVAATNTGLSEEKHAAKASNAPREAYLTKTEFNQTKLKTPVYNRSDLKPGHKLEGPAIILDPYSTTIVEPNWSAYVQKNRTLYLAKLSTAKSV
jgi:5-oxoprolinase (ATP-hydrolysing)